jgi:branched-chain amino acid transport system permease protein
LHLFLTRSFTGRAIQAVSQDRLALQLMGISPTRIKRLAFGISIATAAIAGSLLIIIQPVEPSLGREFIGRAFAVVVLGGMGSFAGMLIAAIVLGITESVVATLYDPSWAPAIAFAFLLPTLAFRSGGLMGRSL